MLGFVTCESSMLLDCVLHYCPVCTLLRSSLCKEDHSEQYDHKEAEVFSIVALLQHCIVWQVLRHKDIGTRIVCFVLFY